MRRRMHAAVFGYEKRRKQRHLQVKFVSNKTKHKTGNTIQSVCTHHADQGPIWFRRVRSFNIAWSIPHPGFCSVICSVLYSLQYHCSGCHWLTIHQQKYCLCLCISNPANLKSFDSNNFPKAYWFHSRLNKNTTFSCSERKVTKTSNRMQVCIKKKRKKKIQSNHGIGDARVSRAGVKSLQAKSGKSRRNSRQMLSAESREYYGVEACLLSTARSKDRQGTSPSVCSAEVLVCRSRRSSSLVSRRSVLLSC